MRRAWLELEDAAPAVAPAEGAETVDDDACCLCDFVLETELEASWRFFDLLVAGSSTKALRVS
jgi:hypothetical protein